MSDCIRALPFFSRPSVVNWFACQQCLKPKSARSIAQNRLTGGTKLRTEQFFKSFEDLNRSFLLELIFGGDEATMDVNKACKIVVGERQTGLIDVLDTSLLHVSLMHAHSAGGATAPLCHRSGITQADDWSRTFHPESQGVGLFLFHFHWVIKS
jgi:hypothetical protein